MSSNELIGGARISVIAAAFFLVFVLGIAIGAIALGPLQGTTAVVTRLETVTGTYLSTITETVTKTVTTTVFTTPRPPERESQYLLRVLEVVVDRVSDASYDYYVLEVEATYRGGKSWPVLGLNFELVSDRGYRYSDAFSLAVKQYLPAVELRDGESARGQIAFKLPKGERPAKLVYEDKLNRILLEIKDLPAPTREVTYVYLVEVDVKSAHSLVFASGSILTPGTAFYSGETIEVEVRVRYRMGFREPETITIYLIDVENFELIRIEPKPPVEVRDGEEVTFRLLLKVPDKGFKGDVKVTVNA